MLKRRPPVSASSDTLPDGRGPVSVPRPSEIYRGILSRVRQEAVCALVALVTLSPTVPLSAQTAPTAGNASQAVTDRELKRLVDIYSLVESHAADPVSPDQAFYEGAIPGLLRRLDPHSVFFDPGQFEQLSQMERSTSKGFGSVVSVLPGRVIVLQVMAGTPSARSGIAPGDEILAVNNIRLDRLEMEQLVQLLTESKQKPAQLYVRRQGSPNLLSFTLTPEEMKSRSVDRAFLLQPGMGYARVTSFESTTGSQLREAIDQMGGENLKGLVLDLRNNPGGEVVAAVETCSLFLKPGQKILTVKGRTVEAKDQLVPAGARPYPFPLAVLVNEKTASASEIVAGALQDHDRATILGLPSYGKGLVQSVFPLEEKTGMALTTAFYYTPSGRSIQKPLRGGEFELSNTAAHPNQLTSFQTDSGRAVQGGGGIIPDILIAPVIPTRLRAALDGSGSFVLFSTEYVRLHPAIDEKFEVTPALLDEFQAYAAEHKIQPGISEWGADRDWITHRLKAEIFNQSVGVDKGDEVDLKSDPQVQKAVEAVSGKT